MTSIKSFAVTLSSARITILGILAVVLAGCAPGTVSDPVSVPAQLIAETKTTAAVRTLPAPARKIDVAVYELPDLTGQHKPNDEFAEFSRAVTQGADSILVDVLTRAGDGAWFNVIERRGLQNLLRERQIIQATRQQYQGTNAAELTPLLFAGVLIEGGIIAYETNLLTGGIGARYLGIGGNAQYQHDIVTVNLRLVSVQTGKVVQSVTTTKQIYSTLVQGSVFRFVALNSLLEVETGFTRNAPPQFAVREAIELGVYALVMEGAKKGIWSFQDQAEGAQTLSKYLTRTGQSGLTNPAANQAAAEEPGAVRQIASAPQQQNLAPAPIAQSQPKAGSDPIAGKKYARSQVDDTKQVRTVALRPTLPVTDQTERQDKIASVEAEERAPAQVVAADTPRLDRKFKWVSDVVTSAQSDEVQENTLTQAALIQSIVPKARPEPIAQLDRTFKWASASVEPKGPEDTVLAQSDTEPTSGQATDERDRKFKWVSADAALTQPKPTGEPQDLAEAAPKARITDRNFGSADDIAPVAPSLEPGNGALATAQPTLLNEDRLTVAGNIGATPELKVRLRPEFAKKIAALSLLPSNR